ncbi:helix-turn-helix domain-containing protein [Paludisphaera rhizosphaerae]|uniref:helix-turn-helix domain-containing protein n=1 Tax=Paludisphaera rhizosphaerae TaxID=2711216 RepID=UPI0013EA741B|nr:hypothetical protein [Paludisphaera rhizosphaerae]
MDPIKTLDDIQARAKREKITMERVLREAGSARSTILRIRKRRSSPLVATLQKLEAALERLIERKNRGDAA